MTLERCVPRPSLRTKRKRGAIAATALVIGLLAALLGGKAGEQFMMPGKLSASHAGLTNCSACHAGARSGHVDLLHRVFTVVEPRQNSNLCVSCHVMGAAPFAPHSHSVEDLRKITTSLRQAAKGAPSESLMQRIAFPGATRSQKAQAEIQCATCHQEHQGVFADLKTVSNQRCQTCHVSRFGAFATSHPQFENFPFRRRPRIIFDHQSHLAKHFPEATKAAVAGQLPPEACTDCHQPGVRRRYMEVKSFGTMCLGCHSGDITGATQVSGPKGIDVIVVPGLDVATLNQRGVDIGGWPRQSEAKLTPFMSLLLESRSTQVISDVKGLNLLDLRQASDQDLARVARLAWAVKRLFKQLQTINPTARMFGNESTGGPVERARAAALTGAMSNDVILAGSRDWFPDLDDDLERHDRGDPTRDFKPMAKSTAAPLTRPSTLSSGSSSPAKAPNTSPSNDILGAAPSGDNKANILTPNGDGKGPNAASKDDILASDNTRADMLTPESKQDILTPTNKADILAPGGDDKSSSGASKDDILAPSNNKDDILAPGKPGGDNALRSAGGDAPANDAGSKTAAASKTAADAKPPPFDPEVWGQAVGWYRQDFAIRYRPTGHADVFLQAWLDFAGQAAGSVLRDQMVPVFASLAPSDAVGHCTKCHSVDDQAGAKIVNWQPFDPNVINNRFTNFTHKPHIELIGAQTCLKCHDMLSTESKFLKSYEGGDTANYTPNFKFIQKSVCAECHSQQAEWENCTVCHGYHVPASSTSTANVLRASMMADAETPAMVSAVDARHDYDLAVQQMARLSAPPPQEPASVAPAVSAPAAADNPATPAPAADASATLPKPDDLEGVYRRGHDSATRGDLELALQDFDEVIRREPNHAAALNDRCWTHALLDELQAALDDCNMSLKIQPNFGDALDSRGLVNLKLGLYKKAISDYTAALLLSPKRASALYGRGIAEQRSGNAVRAKADIAAAKEAQENIVDQFTSYGVQ